MKSKLSMCALAVTLLFAGAAFAQAPAASSRHSKSATTASKAMHTRVASGSIVSADENTLVISHKVKGKAEQMSFNLSAATKKAGDLKAGAKATIHYRVENGENVATSVSAKG